MNWAIRVAARGYLRRPKLSRSEIMDRFRIVYQDPGYAPLAVKCRWMDQTNSIATAEQRPPMPYRLTTILMIAGICLGSYGCTYRAWHAGLQEGQRQQCYKLASSDAMQRCLNEVNSMTYDQYEKAREDSKKSDK